MLENQLRGKAYTRFLEDLREYLADFLARTQPLVDLEEVNGRKAPGRFPNPKALRYVGSVFVCLPFRERATFGSCC